jgi:phosphoenolpyruvate carboxykinase (ATP)
MKVDKSLKNTNLLESYGIKSTNVNMNLTPDELHNKSLLNGLGKEADSGALIVNTGEFTGRSPKDRFIVKDSITKDKVWWGDVNIPFDEKKFDKLENKIINYLSNKELYVQDAFVCADEDHRMNLRLITEVCWAGIFSHNMFLRPEVKELDNFEAEWSILHAPGFLADPNEDGTRQHNFSIINFKKKRIIIGGTSYTGEIKKGIFSVLNFILPTQKNTLPMHCSSNVGENGDTAVFFGLSGTGKSTLSTDPNRKLIGDDEHGWTVRNTVFNFEGGCYAKVIDLSEEKEPEIYGAIKKGAMLENVFCDKHGKVDFSDGSITQNTRVSYPIHHINNIQQPSIGENVKNIFFLTADAFGVLPPISKLTPNQAAYHFISGYTAKIAGTEDGVVEPMPSFSACFGAPFMPLHPAEYAKMLSKRMRRTGVNVWMINTGWTGGPYGVGTRIKLEYTRAMINAVLRGELGAYTYENYHIHSVFGVVQPRKCTGVPSSLLSPRTTWNDDKAYYTTAFKLSNAFRENFKNFEEGVSEEIRRGGPQRFTF